MCGIICLWISWLLGMDTVKKVKRIPSFFTTSSWSSKNHLLIAETCLYYPERIFLSPSWNFFQRCFPGYWEGKKFLDRDSHQDLGRTPDWGRKISRKTPSVLLGNVANSFQDNPRPQWTYNSAAEKKIRHLLLNGLFFYIIYKSLVSNIPAGSREIYWDFVTVEGLLRVIFWLHFYKGCLQGKESDTFEKAASAILAVQLDGQVGGAAKQVRVLTEAWIL